MPRLLKAIIAATFLIIVLGVPAFSRSSSHEHVEFEINVPFRLAHSNVLLPPGKFLLYQPDTNDPNLFALYRDDLMQAPIAWITTTRVEYLAGDYPETTNLVTDVEEEDGTEAINKRMDCPWRRWLECNKRLCYPVSVNNVFIFRSIEISTTLPAAVLSWWVFSSPSFLAHCLS